MCIGMNNYWVTTRYCSCSIIIHSNARHQKPCPLRHQNNSQFFSCTLMGRPGYEANIAIHDSFPALICRRVMTLIVKKWVSSGYWPLKLYQLKMLHKLIVCQILLLLDHVLFALGQELIQPGPPDFCFKTKSVHTNDQYHKDIPSPQGSDFPECQSWKEYSCCTRALTETLHRNRDIGLYNFSHVLCGTISPLCEEYLLVCKIAIKINQLANFHVASIIIAIIINLIFTERAHTHAS